LGRRLGGGRGRGASPRFGVARGRKKTRQVAWRWGACWAKVDPRAGTMFAERIKSGQIAHVRDRRTRPGRLAHHGGDALRERGRSARTPRSQWHPYRGSGRPCGMPARLCACAPSSACPPPPPWCIPPSHTWVRAAGHRNVHFCAWVCAAEGRSRSSGGASLLPFSFFFSCVGVAGGRSAPLVRAHTRAYYRLCSISLHSSGTRLATPLSLIPRCVQCQH
jgi:hypothetical protein